MIFSRYTFGNFRSTSLVLAFSLFACALCLGCQGKSNTATAASKVSRAPLSPEAQRLYYTLVITQAATDQNQDGIIFGVKGLLELDNSLASYHSAGAMLVNNNLFDAAIQLLENGVQLYPDDFLLLQMLSVSYSESGKAQKAIPLLSAFLEKHPHAHDVLQELLRLYLRSGQLDQAKKYIHKLPPTTNPQAAYLNARILAASGRFSDAQKILVEQSRKTPKDPDAWVELGLLAEQRNQPELAAKYYIKGITFSPGNVSLALKAMTQLLAVKDIAAVKKLIRRPFASTELRIQAALLLNEKGYTTDAEEILTEETKKPDDPVTATYYLSMVVLYGTNDAQRAKKILDSIPEDSPLFAHALEQKIRICLFEQDYDAAFEQIEKGKKKFPDTLVFWELQVFSLANVGKQEEAFSVLQTLLKSHPDNQDVLFLFASMEDEFGNKSKALDIMEQIIRVNPRNARALNYIGYTLAEGNKDLNRAHSLLLTAVQESPDSAYIVDSFAWVLYRLGKYHDAWEQIQHCIALGGDEATIWEHYSDIAFALKKKKEAIEGLQKAIDRTPDNIETLEKKLEKVHGK